MSSYRQHLYHLVFRTKNSVPTIKQDHVNELYAYIARIVKNKNSHLYRINGVANHLHTSPGSTDGCTVDCTGGYSNLAPSEPINEQHF
jgi:hypothetical protein